MGIWKIATKAAIMSRTQYNQYIQNVDAQGNFAVEMGLDLFDSFEATRKLGITSIVDDHIDFSTHAKWPSVSPDLHSHHWDMYHLQPWVNSILNIEFVKLLTLASKKGSIWEHLKPSYRYTRMYKKKKKTILSGKEVPVKK